MSQQISLYTRGLLISYAAFSTYTLANNIILAHYYQSFKTTVIYLMTLLIKLRYFKAQKLNFNLI